MALGERFEAALVMAARLHRDQVRKETPIPYVSHLLAVAGLVLEHGGSEDEAIAALLHDAIEDQGGAKTRELIRERFGDAVAEIVSGCSDTDASPKPPWRARKQAYVSHLAQASPSVRLVALADKVHNARSILADYRSSGDAVWGRFSGGREGMFWYYGALREAFRAHGGSPLLDELDRVVSELERLAAPPRP